MQVELPEWSAPLWEPYRYKAMHGGRGGSKSWTVGTILPIIAANDYKRILCGREIQLSIKQSVKKLLEMQIERLGMTKRYKINQQEIIHRDTGSEFIFMGLRDQDPDKIKSLESIDIAWLEEAHTISQASLDILAPTIRNPGSEIWLTWNNRYKNDAVSQTFLINDPPPKSWVVHVNYDSNPWFPEVLREEMEHCRDTDPAKFQHVWAGGYKTITEGAFYAKEMSQVLNDGRLTEWNLSDHNDLNGVMTWWDLGRNDYTSIWFAKFLAGEIHVIDYYENRFEHIDHYIEVVKKKPYEYERHYLPHDANNKTLAQRKSAYEYVKLANMPVTVIPRTKSVLDDIEAVRRILPLCQFYKPNCSRGVDHLIEYKRKQNAATGIFEENAVHDEASHGADAFRYMAVTHPLNKRDYTVHSTKIGGI